MVQSLEADGGARAYAGVQAVSLGTERSAVLHYGLMKGKGSDHTHSQEVIASCASVLESFVTSIRAVESEGSDGRQSIGGLGMRRDCGIDCTCDDDTLRGSCIACSLSHATRLAGFAADVAIRFSRWTRSSGATPPEHMMNPSMDWTHVTAVRLMHC